MLAAGAGSRFAGPVHKLLTEVAGRPLVHRAVAAAQAAGLSGGVLVISGAVALDEALADLVGPDVAICDNPDWASGQASSLRTGVDAARRRGAGAVVVGLGDQPGVLAEAWRAVAASASPIAVATYGGRRRNPVRLARAVWPWLPTGGDEGARSLVQQRPDLVEAVACPGDPSDVDHQEDLRRWS